MIQFSNFLFGYCEFMEALGIGWQPYLSLFGLMVLIPSMMATVLLLVNRLWLKPVLWTVLGCTGAFLWAAWWLGDNKVQLGENRLHIQAGFYQTELTDLTLPSSSISVMGLHDLGSFAPEVMVNGINLPNYRVGWFRLVNNDLAFVMLIGTHAEVTLVKTASMTAIVSGDIQRGKLVAFH